MGAWIVGGMVASTLVFYTGVTRWPSPGELCKALALVALGLLALALTAGPLVRLRPWPIGRALMRERRRLGLCAFAFGLAHAALALACGAAARGLPPGSLGSLAGLRLGSLAGLRLGSLAGLRLGGLALAALALAILALLAATSPRRVRRRLGAARWQRLHRLGALALVLAVAHFVLMELGPRGFHVRPYGRLVLAGALAALAIRALAKLDRFQPYLKAFFPGTRPIQPRTTAIPPRAEEFQPRLTERKP